jgi:hypothetical protein
MDRKYKVVTCASFGNTGSGVVTDFLQEFDNIGSLGDYEFRFLQDYDGVSTLENALVNNPHRLNSDIAIRNFIRYVDFQCGDITSKRYEKFFKGDFRKLAYQYVDELIDAKWPGYWEQYQIYKPFLYRTLMYKVIPRLLREVDFKHHYLGSYYIPSAPMYFAAPDREKFIYATRKFMAGICCSFDPNQNKEYLFFDQIVPPTNIERYLDYFDNLKVIVVDRDVRDSFIDNTFRWKERWIPYDVETFIKVNLGMRKPLINEKPNPNILRISFENAIYHYDSFKKAVMDFLELESKNHSLPFKYFNPKQSIRNTQLWKQFPVNINAIKRIEEAMPEYCYHF